MRLRAKSACGFSLVELLLVVAFVAVAIAVSLPTLRGTVTAYRLRASADIVAGELDAARVMAISRGAVYRVSFTGNTVLVEDPQDPSRRPRLPKRLEDGVTVTAGPDVLFRPRGTCSGGLIRLQDTHLKMAFINVTATGKITVSLGNYGGSGTTTSTD